MLQMPSSATCTRGHTFLRLRGDFGASPQTPHLALDGISKRELYSNTRSISSSTLTFANDSCGCRILFQCRLKGLFLKMSMRGTCALFSFALSFFVLCLLLLCLPWLYLPLLCLSLLLLTVDIRKATLLCLPLLCLPLLCPP